MYVQFRIGGSEFWNDYEVVTNPGFLGDKDDNNVGLKPQYPSYLPTDR